MNTFLPCNTLEEMPKRTSKLLQLELDLETLAEFSAACEVFGARSKSTFLNQFVVSQIREAKNTVSRDEFDKLREKHLREILERSERKSLERKQAISKVTGQTKIKASAKASVGTGVKPQLPENAELNFNGSKSRKSKTKEQALIDELDEVLEKRKK